jgi:hypothetical protein
MPGARCARSRAWCVVDTRVSHHGHTGNTRHSPRNGFNGYFVLSPVTGLVCHRHQRKLPFANLTPASGRQDHTTSPSAGSALVSSATCVHRIPPPTSVTIAKRPSEEAGPNRYISVSTSRSRENSENPKFCSPTRCNVSLSPRRTSSSRSRKARQLREQLDAYKVSLDVAGPLLGLHAPCSR